MKKHNNFQTQLIHAPRKAPQFIETVQPPLFRASTIIFKSTSHLLTVIGPILMTIVMAPTVRLRHSH